MLAVKQEQRAVELNAFKQALQVDVRVCTMTRTHVGVGVCGGQTVGIVVKDCMTQKLSFFAEEVIAVAEVARIGEIEDALRWFCWQLRQLCSNASPSAPCHCTLEAESGRQQ
jgi:hypothetical protein